MKNKLKRFFIPHSAEEAIGYIALAVVYIVFVCGLSIAMLMS